MLCSADELELGAGIPLAEAAKLAGVSIYTVGMWAVRGKVRVVGHDHKGHALYRYGDVMDTAAATAEHPNNRRPRVVPA